MSQKTTNKKTKDVYGIKNVNFSLIEKNDERWNEFKKQREENGFDESELWSLDITIAKFVYPRLKLFYENIQNYPGYMTFDEWKNIIKTMLDAFELLSNDELIGMYSEEQEKIIENGLQNFGKYYRGLWR